jgi:hypothetical protein
MANFKPFEPTTKFEDIRLLDIGNTIQLVGAMWSGNGQLYLCMFPGNSGNIQDVEGNDCTGFITDTGEDLTVSALNMDVAEWEKFIRQTDLLETEVLAQAADGKLAKIILRKSGRSIAQEISWKVYLRDEFRCRYCGAGPGIPLTVDHLVLWEEGGPSIAANLVAADKTCNRKRGNLPYDQWLEHPYYKKVSANLTEEQREANRRLADTLKGIPRMIHKPGKRK